MTRKDYEKMAKEIRRQVARNYYKTPECVYAMETLRDLVLNLGVEFLDDNPRFNADKFYKACGL